MSKSFTKKYEIHYYEVDAKLKCKLSSIIDFLGDIGTQQSEEIGVGMEYFVKNNCGWVFYKDDITMYRYPNYGEKITIVTYPIGFKKFYGLRKYILKDEKDNVIGEALALFFLIDAEKRRPMRIQKEQYDAFGVDGDIDHNIDMDKVEKMSEEQYSKQFYIRYSDIDSNNHVNNASYIEWAMEVVPLNIVNEYRIARVKIVFEKETTYGEAISSLAQIKGIDETKLKSYHTIKNYEDIEVAILEIDWEKID